MNPLIKPKLLLAGTSTFLKPSIAFTLIVVALGFPGFAPAQQTEPAPPERNADAAPARPPGTDGPPFGGPFGPGGFPGGPGGMGPMRQEVKLVEKFDKDDNGWLNAEERKPARESLAKDRAEGRGGRGPFGPGRRGGPGGAGGPGGPGGFPGQRENQTPPEPGPRVSPGDVKPSGAAPFYDLQTVRTLFLEFENADWEKELSDFHDTDVEVPAKLTVDGKTYEGVGVHFRGASSYMMIGEGRKRSLNLTLDLANEDQRLGGYRTLNLLNSNGDPTMLRAVLYDQVAREYIAAPKANWVRVVINGESWGVYVNVQQFNKDFVEEWFGSKKGARWKAPGRPNGNSGLEYLGDDVAEYRKRFEIKSKDEPKSWEALIQLCRVLNQTPADQLVEKLSPLLDIDAALKYLALDNVFINTDGYWTRASDYSLYLDAKGRFHIVPHDVNETFRAPEGPGMQGRTKGVELDPLAGADDAKKPLLNKLLAVPELRARYLKYIGEIATQWLDWNKLGPLAQQYQALIADLVKIDTRKLASYDAFTKGVSEDTEEQGFRGPRRSMSLKSFVEQRRAYLLNHPEIKKVSPTAPGS